jgi:hypothetical protein
VLPPEPAAAPQSPAQLSLSGHCLLRLMTALLLETQGMIPIHPAASAELNRRTGRCHSAAQWVAILAPAFRRRFCPGDEDLRLL